MNKTKNIKRQTENFIEKVIELKKRDIDGQKKYVSFKELQNTVSFSKIKKSEFSFRKKFENKNRFGLIAEIKFASPTNSDLGSHEDLLLRTKEYEDAGADAISLITEKHFFKGDGMFISQVKKHSILPVIQKDFVIDPYQIYEAKIFGSDALLLIARLVDKQTLKEFVEICFSLGLEPVVEINNREDLEKAVETNAHIIAVNARDLETLEIDVTKAYELLKKIPNRFVKLGFSGIKSSEEVLNYKKSGANGILIGTSLMKTDDINGFIKGLQL